MKRQAASRAFVLPDAMMGMAILALLTTIVTVELSWRSKAEKRLENHRAAVAEAELSLSEFHAGQSPDSTLLKDIRTERVAGGAHVAGYEWVRVIATHDGESAAIVGLAKGLTNGGS